MLANNEDRDEMPHKATFHQCLHHLLKDKINLERKKYNFLEIVVCDPHYKQWTILNLWYVTSWTIPLV